MTRSIYRFGVGGFRLLSSHGGQALLMFVLYLCTVTADWLGIPQSDIQKQAFAAIVAFLGGQAIAGGRKGR